MNVKMLLEVMKNAGWTPEDFFNALNSKIKVDRDLKRTESDNITIDQAKTFMTNGGGLDNGQYDILERWVEARMGADGLSTTTFPKPQPMRVLDVNRPPVIVPDELEMVENGSIVLDDVTNHRARKKFIAA